MKKKILVCVGTWPNFIKVVRLRRLLTENGFDFVLLHTGQHFDTAMSDVFFEQLKLGQPDYCLEIQGGDINQVTSRLISEIDLVLKKETPDLAVAVGDVAKYSNNPGKQHWMAVKRILRYVKETIKIRLQRDSWKGAEL